MSAVTGLFKRARSKSEKAQTPPKVVFGDLGSAYASITQKGTPSTPNLRRAAHDGVVSPAETNAPWSPVQASQSESSASAPLLQHTSPDAIRVSHLSGGLFLPRGFDAGLPKPNIEHGFDPFSDSDHERSSINTLDIKKRALDMHFGTLGDQDADPIPVSDKIGSPRETNLLSPSEYPELKEDQLEAFSKLAGADGVDMDGTQPLDRCATIQSVATRHEYGDIGTNDDIHSLRGSHVDVEDGEDERAIGHSGAQQQTTVEEVQWSPRPSSELYALDKANVVRDRPAGGPPAIALPATPKGKGITRNDELHGFSSPMEQASRSSESYGNTRGLLDLSLPQFPQASGEQTDDFFQDLVKFAKEGQSSSSRGASNKSFATFSIKDAEGNPITRPVTQGEFQTLENAIGSHLRRGSQASNMAAGAEFRHVGQISLTFPEGPEAGVGPGSNQSASSSDNESVVDFGAIQPALRTRNGTPPLLFGGSSRSKRETDWETVGDSNQTTSSVADYSDSASRSPPKSLLSVEPGKVLKRPAHPRYNHSWDLQQDVRSGAYVLTPKHKLTGGTSFPNHKAFPPLSAIGARNYSHPTPLKTGHSHPFASSAPQIGSSQSAGIREPDQPFDANKTGKAIGSHGSSAWLSTTGPSTSGVATSAAEVQESTPLKAPPLPTRNPYRQLKKFVSEEGIELQTMNRSQPRLRLPQNDSASDMVELLNPFDLPDHDQGTPPSTPLTHPTDAVIADTITPPRRHNRADRRGPRQYLPVPHPVYGSYSRGADLPRLHPQDPNPTAPPTSEQRIARRYLTICGCVPVLLPLYASGYLDFVMRIHTRGAHRAFPRWERQAAWGILAAWIVVAVCVVPFSTFARQY